MINLFKKKTPEPRESAPQLTLWQRRALELASPIAGGHPHTTYDEMERDAMVQTALNVKRLAVVSTDWRIEPSTDTALARQAADFASECFIRMDGTPLTILQQAMDAFAHGWSVQELVYESAGPRIRLKTARSKDPSLFGLRMDAFGRLQNLILQMPGESEKILPPEKFVIYMNRGSLRSLKGRSDLDAAYRHWRAKHNLLSAWQLHLERFAMPTVMGRYERGLAPDEQSAILTALRDLQNSTAIVFPEEIQISTLGGEKEPTQGFQESIEFHNREIARAILGQTLTTDEGRRVGSLALGKVHLQVMMLQINALRRSLADTVLTEQVLRPLTRLNFGDVEPPRFILEETPLESFSSGTL